MKRKKYSTADYIDSIASFLEKKYGAVNDEWQLSLTLLQQNLDLKREIDEKIKEDGLMVIGVKGLMKNPLIETSLRLQTNIMSIIKELGVTPKANGMLKSLDDNDTGEILANLLGNDE